MPVWPAMRRRSRVSASPGWTMRISGSGAAASAARSSGVNAVIAAV